MNLLGKGASLFGLWVSFDVGRRFEEGDIGTIFWFGVSALVVFAIAIVTGAYDRKERHEDTK